MNCISCKNHVTIEVIKDRDFRVLDMIPLRLYLKNFLSYGSPGQTINLAPYHLICLSGRNGHGKSAFLDALTWSLWGQARKTAHSGKSDENLLKLGQTEMIVMLDFMCNNVVYRVRREFNRERAKVMSQLDFGIVDVSGEKFVTLTGKTMRDTQELINRTIGLDGDAFQCTAFLRQGHSDEFSRKPPKDRKDVLAKLLGLDVIEQLRKKITEKLRDMMLSKQHKERLCEHLTGEVQHHIQMREELTQAALRLSELTLVETEKMRHFKELGVEHTKLQAILTMRRDKEVRIQRLEDMMLAQRNLLVPTFQKWRAVNRLRRLYQHQVLADEHRKSLVAARTGAQQAREQELMLRDEMQILIVTRRERMAMIHQSFVAEKITQQQNVDILQKKLQEKCDERDGLKRCCDKLIEEQRLCGALLEAALKKRDMLQYTVPRAPVLNKERIVERSARFRSHREYIARERVSLHEQLVALQNTKEAVCTWCLRIVTVDDAAAIVRQISRRLDRLVRHNDKVERCLVHLDTNLALCREYEKKMEIYQGDLEMVFVTIRDFERRHEKITQDLHFKEETMQKVQQEGEELRTHVQQIAERIQELNKREDAALHDSTLVQLHEQIVRYEQKIGLLGQPLETLVQIQAALDKISQDELQAAQARTDIALQSERVQQVHTLCGTLRQLRDQRQELLEELKEYGVIDIRCGEVGAEQRVVQEVITVMRQEREELIRRKGSLEQSCRHLEAQQMQLAQEREMLRTLHQEIEDDQLLIQAFSKDGIQGMIIEQVLPDIEQEANYLLAKLTDNQTQLRFESVRELKNGALKETLDIQISDAHGIRPYELFSGGEAFRIDFALRLAISKFLAKRSGASVQTLIIDEGFGSQDEEGLNRIMEALYAIQNDFAKIIIVSHLSSMKDQFPTHFHIQKGPRGSFVQVVQQG